MHLYGIGDHGGGPTRDMLDSGMRWMEPNKVYPHLEFGPSQTFFDTMAKQVDTADAPTWNYETLAAGKTQVAKPTAGKIWAPVWNDELYLEFHRGTYTTQAKHKWNLRHGSEWLLNAEKYSSSGVAWAVSTIPAHSLPKHGNCSYLMASTILPQALALA